MQIAYIDIDDAVSPMSSSNDISITGAIEGKQGRDVMINDVPNVFVQTPVPQYEGDEIVIMKIRGALVDIICEISPEIKYHM